MPAIPATPPLRGAEAAESPIDLLAAANGKLGISPVQGDPVASHPADPASLLETSAAQRRPQALATERADAIHAKSKGGFGYRVTVAGEYYAKSPDTTGNVVKQYRLDFNLPCLVGKPTRLDPKGESALGMIVGASKPVSLLKLALKRLDPMALTYRTHEIVSVQPLSSSTPPPTSLLYMSIDALKNYVKENLLPAFPVDPDDYWDVRHLREDVIDFKTNYSADTVAPGETLPLKTAVDNNEKLIQRIVSRQGERVELRALLAMNDGLGTAEDWSLF